MAHKINLIGNKMQFIVKPDEPYYDPQTGLYIPRRPNPKCSGSHNVYDIYWEPCVDCEKFCNCHLVRKYPDILVTSLEGLTVQVSGNVVASSDILFKLIDEHRLRSRRLWLTELLDTLGLRESYQKMAKEEDVHIYEKYPVKKRKIETVDLTEPEKQKEVEVITIDSSSEEEVQEVYVIRKAVEVIDLSSNSGDDHKGQKRVDQTLMVSYSEDETVPLSELFEFPKITVFDLRNGTEPTFGLTAAQWAWLEKFVGLHLDQVDENIAAERRAREYFRLSLYKRPEKAPINHFGYYDWEVDLFMNMSPEEMLQLSQMKHELEICDLNAPLEKWFHLRRGIPMIDDFGWGQFRTDLHEEWCDTGIEDFLGERARVMWNHGVTIHALKVKMKIHDPRNALRFRKMAWQSWPRSNLCRLRRK